MATPDAGSGGNTDSGVVDAGSMDAGVVDAGSIDAGVSDAGVFDAGTLEDAGTEDGGSMPLPPEGTLVISYNPMDGGGFRLARGEVSDGGVTLTELTGPDGDEAFPALSPSKDHVVFVRRLTQTTSELRVYTNGTDSLLYECPPNTLGFGCKYAFTGDRHGSTDVISADA
jgi:hypothetical protein